MASFNKYQSFVEALAEKVHNLGSDTVKIVLTNSAPNAATHTVLADVTQVANGGGYTTGGNTAAVSTSAQSSGTYKLVLTSPTAWTGSGGGFGPFRYVVAYNDTAASDQLIGYWDYGSSISVAAAETFTVTFDGTNGVLQIV